MTTDTTFATDLVVLDVEIINGIACPIDPQEALNCESCQ